MRIIKIGILCSLLLSIQVLAQQWTNIADFPGTQRDDGVSFVIQDQAYCGTGLEVGWNPTRNFYHLNMSSHEWVEIASMPANTQRQYACAFSVNQKGYVFGGVNTDALNDLWQYDSNTNQWSALTPKPGLGLSGASCFVLNDTAFFVGGANSATQASKQVWAYVVSSDSWYRLNDFPYNGLWRSTSCTVNQVGYVMGGKDSTNHYNEYLYRYYPASDTWSVVHSSPLSARTYAASCSVLSQLVMIAGLDSAGIYHSDAQYFRFSDSSWVSLSANLPKPRKGGMCFSNYTSLFYTTGIDSDDVRLSQCLEWMNPTGSRENEQEEGVVVFPTITHECLYTNMTDVDELLIYDLLGNCVDRVRDQRFIATNSLMAGNYFAEIRNSQTVLRRQFFKQ